MFHCIEVEWIKEGYEIMTIDNKKEQEREELHRAIWAIADELRGAVDGWDYKKLCFRYHVL